MFNILIAAFIPFLGTLIGSLIVFIFKHKLNEKLEKVLLGFASGVMIAASIWSLIVPSINMSSDMGKLSILPASIGFICGVLFLLLLDSLLPHLHAHSEEAEGVKSNLNKDTMMFLAVTIHNIPEGMALGVVLAGILIGNIEISFAGAIALSIGIAIQNIPEGAIVAFDMKSKGNSNEKSFLHGTVSGIVEPLGSLLMILFSSLFTSILPYFLSFAAGAMIYVVVEELIPQSQNGKHSNLATIGVAIGFVLMMVLDVMLA